MTSPLRSIQLTADQQGQVLGILSVGCDRETAAGFVACAPADIARAMQVDPAFGTVVRRTEAAAELTCMRTVHQAAKDVKTWRAAVWWLERRSPERFASRGAGTVTTRQLRIFLTIIGDLLNEEIHDSADRQRVLARLNAYDSLADNLVNDLWRKDDDAESHDDERLPSESTDSDPAADDDAFPEDDYSDLER